MRTFLGVLMVVVIVSGDDNTITGDLGDSVLLPCNCSERNTDKEFKWQMEEPKKTLVFKYDRNTSNFSGRVKTFLDESHNNCSVFLTNITASDQGTYKCIFWSQGLYKTLSVNLNVSARYTVCRTNMLNGDLSVKVFQCNVTGRYNDTEIQWNLDGQLLTNSSTTNITSTYTLDVPTGIYHFLGKLSTKLNMTSEPTCDVKAKGISTNISNDCRTVAGIEMVQKNTEYNMRYVKIFPIMLVLGLSLVLWRRWKSSQSLQRTREMETNNF